MEGSSIKFSDKSEFSPILNISIKGSCRIYRTAILKPENVNPITRSIFFPPSLLRIMHKGRNINRLSIAIPRTNARLRLGPPHPLLIAIAEETLDYRRSEFSSDLWLLMPAFSLPCAPACLTTYLHCTRNAPLPRIRKSERTHAFGDILSPVTFSAHLTQIEQ